MDRIKPEELLRKSKDNRKENSSFFRKLKKNKPKDLDQKMQALHEQVFDYVDCLQCANCCKTISPMITNKDVDRMAKFLKIKPAELAQKYLHIDEDGDYVFNDTPCPFLMPDNYCMVYEARPKACSGYPHTDRKKFYQLLDITEKNLFICPAVYQIIEKLKEIYLQSQNTTRWK